MTPKRISNPPPLPSRPIDGQKGLFGRVLILGGSETMIGAPILAGTAALRMGAGLVQIAMPRSVLATALSVTPELIGLSLGPSKNHSVLLAAAEKSDALVVGPGLGASPLAAARVMALIRLQKPMVLDADALNDISRLRKWPAFCKAAAVLTPHPGEMARLGKLIARPNVPTDEAGRIELATFAAKSFAQVVLLKGHRTVVADGNRVYVNHTGDSSLSKAGAGDVLSGMIAALLAVGMDRFAAACLAAHLHGRAGELAGQRLGRRCVLARDVIGQIPGAIAEYEGVGLPAGSGQDYQDQ
jgi:ADP-dependent NAD(P)H-hydrate dehydratase